MDKIFNEGLKTCTAFIIVLSNNTVNSKWVREELNSAIVKRIEDNTKLIPIRLDHCEIPTALKDILWIDIPDPANYDREFERILNAIHRQYSKPPLGQAPACVRLDVLQMDGLSAIDSIIFEHACKIAIEQGHSIIISGERLVAELGAQGISEQQIMESQEVLEGRLYIELHRVWGPPHAYGFAITSYGFDQFARIGVPDYGKICEDVARQLVRQDDKTNTVVAEELHQPIRIVDHILEALKYNGQIKYTQTLDGEIDVHWVSPELRRKLEQND